MLISGNWVQSAAKTTETPSGSGNLQLAPGTVVAGRITQVSGQGEGVLRLADGRGFSFSGGQALKEGEPVRLEVVRLQPQITFRLMGSESGTAQRLAGDMEQSLMRLPDVFSRLMNLSGLGGAGGLERDGGLNTLFSALRSSSGHHPLFVTSKGESLAAVLQRVLPNLSLQSLQQGDFSELTRLLQGGRSLPELLQQLREAANDLRPGRGGGGEVAAQELGAARQTLGRVGDLLAMQELLPRVNLSPDGDPYLGYRLFWLDERGLGELIWRRHQGGKSGRGGEGEEEVTSVLVTLNLTRLGTVQARLSFQKNSLQIALGAEGEEALSALREDVRQLRQALIQAELPVRSLDLSRMSRASLQEERHTILELGEGFSIEV